MVSTFRVNCGVGKYLEELSIPLSKICDLKIFAETVHQQLAENEPMNGSENINYTRCWKRGEPYGNLIKEIEEFSPDVLHFQFQNYMFKEDLRSTASSFISMVNGFTKKGTPVFITLHDVIAFDPLGELFSSNPRTTWYSALKGVTFIVTNKAEQEELKKWAPSSKSYVIPLGSTLFEPKDKEQSKLKLQGLYGKPILEPIKPPFWIIQPGFFGADKGMLQLIDQMPEVKISEASLIFAGSIHPLAPEGHRSYVKECLKRALSIRAQGGRVSFIPKFFNEDDLNIVLSAADVLVLNHDQSLYVGSSACAKRILCAGKPLIFSDSDPRLSEFEDGKHCLKIGRTRNFSEAVREIYNNPSLRETLIKGAREYANETSFEKIAEKHMEAYNEIAL